MNDRHFTDAASRGVTEPHSSYALTDLSDRPYRLRRAPKRNRFLRRLLSASSEVPVCLTRVTSRCRAVWTDARESWGGAEGRVLRVCHGAAGNGSRSVALYAHFSPFSGISEMVVGQLREYARLGFRVVFISASPSFDEADFARINDVVELAIHRRNFGLDFGGWVDALALAPEIGENLDELLLVNDSVLGPLYPLDSALAQMRAGGEGLFGMTESVQHAPHLQSYFLLARGAAAVADIIAFLQSGRLSASKWLMVKRFEVALSEHMRDQGHRVAALWSYDHLENELLRSEEDAAALFTALSWSDGVVGGRGWRSKIRRQLFDLPLNPVHFFAGILVRRCRFPFLKAELVLRNPQRIPEALDWRALLPEEAPVSVRMIEDHLAAYERPLRVPRRSARPGPPIAGDASAYHAHRAEPEAEQPVWRQTLVSAWNRRNDTVPPCDKRPDTEARDILARISRFPLVISFSHDDYAASCGGVQNVIHAEQLEFAAQGLSYIHLSPVTTASRMADIDPSACFSVRLDGSYMGTASLDTLLDVCHELGRRKAVLASIVHHLWGHAPEHIEALHKAAGARQGLFWLHDFGSLCESSALLRNDIAFCGAPPPDSSSCMICVHGATRVRHVGRLHAFFEAVSPTVLAPSATALDFWTRHAGITVAHSAVVPPASLVPLPTPPIARPTRSRLRVAHVGARTFHKGWEVFADLAKRFSGDGRYEFLQIGVDEALPLTPHVRHIQAQVRPGDQMAMVDAVSVEEVDVVVNWSLCFETFSFITHEAIAGGAFVITRPQSGNIWQTIRQNAPRQGYMAGDEEELQKLFATNGLRDLLTDAHRARHRLVLGGASADWLGVCNAEARNRSLRGNG